jgi:molecular chaperone DnaK
MSKKIIGIDLGTTNSVISVLEGANPTIIPNAEGNRTTPSVVAYTATGDILVGQFAKRQNVVNPENTFYSIKRFIGAKYEEVKEERQRVSYLVKSDENGKIKVHCPLLNKDFTPEEISSTILKKLVNDASNHLNEKITNAIITVPAYFNDSQRLATKDAGTIAGLDVLRILNEPTAAALAYGLDKKKNEVVLIFDLGGGTFDVSILEVGDDVFEVLSTAGDTHLGGDDFDQILVNFALKSFKEKEGIDLSINKESVQRILQTAEIVKMELSRFPTTQFSIPYLYVDGSDFRHLDETLDRSKFESLCEKLIKRCKVPVEKALQDASLEKEDIDEVILVGGSTRIPAIRNLLKGLIGKQLNETVNPDEVVAMGAAVQAGILAGEITDLILLDVTPLSLGVETIGGLMTTIIKRNVSIPVREAENFTTAIDGQEDVEIHVLQGERPFADDNKSLGIFKLRGIPDAPKGVPQIKVIFQLDVDGLLSVSAREEDTGIEQSIKIEGASVLDREEVDQMLKEAQENETLDIAKKVISTISNQLDNLFLLFEQVFILGFEFQAPYSLEYLEEIINEIEELYMANDFSTIANESIDELSNVHKFFINEYIADSEPDYIDTEIISSTKVDD